MTKLQDFLNKRVVEAAPMNRGAKNGDLFGIELECEGRNVDWDGTPDISKHWAPHADGSLRNNHGQSCEWVFNGPVKYEKSVERVNKLFEYFATRKARLVTSNRTSTHVHFNMADKTVYQVINLFILFTILEDILDTYCGEDRKGNLFCLSSRHAEQQIAWVSDACFKHHNLRFNNNARYCSLNLASLNKFGTVEFRGMRGLDNADDILRWLSIINDFCQYACYTMKNPSKLIEEISAKRPLGFLKEIFSEDNYYHLIEGWTEEQIDESIFEGLRLVQMLCYKIGTEFGQVRLRGRDFWASFENNDEPELDIKPEDVGRVVARGRRGAQVAPDIAQPAQWIIRDQPFQINHEHRAVWARMNEQRAAQEPRDEF